MDLLFELAAPDEGEDLQRLYDRLAERFGFGRADVRLSRRKLTGGEIRYGRPHTITISAHAWAFARRGRREGHGPFFRKLARQLGAKGRAAPVTEALTAWRARRRQIVYRCEGCAALFRRFRAFRGARYCVACERAGRPSRIRRVRDEP